MSIRKEISKSQIFSEGVKGKFWKAIEDTLKPELDNTKREIEVEQSKLCEGNDRKLLVLIERRTRLEGFLGIKDFIKAERIFKDRLEKKQDQIKEYREKLYGGRISHK